MVPPLLFTHARIFFPRSGFPPHLPFISIFVTSAEREAQISHLNFSGSAQKSLFVEQEARDFSIDRLAVRKLRNRQ